MDDQSLTLLAVVFYLCVLTLLLLYVFVARKASVFEPIGMFLFFTSLFTLPLPIRYCLTREIEGNVSPFLEQFAPYLPLSVVLTALSMVVFVGAYFSRWARVLGNRLPLLRDRGVQGTGVGILALIALCVVLIYLLTESVGGIIPFLLLGYRSSEETFGRGYLAVGFPWLVVAMLALFDRFAVTRRWIDAALGLTMLLVTLAIFGITGNRTMMMYLAIALVVFVNLRISKISLKILAPVALVGFLGLNLMGALRGSDYQDVEEFVEKTFSPSKSGVTGDKENLFYTLTIGEFVVPFETLPQMIRTVGVSDMPWMGLSYLRAPVYLIPSFILPDRPLPVANWYMEKFYGGGYGLNEGRAFFFLSEGYLNFGPFGVFLIALAWGVAWGGLQRWMIRGRERVGTVLIYALLTAFMFRCISGDVVTLLVGTTQQSLVAVMLVLIIANVFGGRRNASRGLAHTSS